MRVETFIKAVNADYFTGVPDSLLKPLCDYFLDTYGIDYRHHVIAANEGNAVGLAAGYHLATGKVPVVYMQNSGEGNIINPVASLLNDRVYAIPCIFVVGWRGEPGVHDEPQHVYQGEVTRKLLEVMDIENYVVSKETSEEELTKAMEEFKKLLIEGKQVAIVIKKGALEYDRKTVREGNGAPMTREEVIRHIIEVSGEDPIVSTTGKASRELFEAREANTQGHGLDFLTVGSMGHCSSIALSVAEFKPEKKIWCVDGDGAALMHMGAMAVIANAHPRNMVHIVINNGAHETVGGQPTVAGNIKLSDVARDVGYPFTYTVSEVCELDNALKEAKERNDLTFIEIKCGIGSRADLGRPTTTAVENKKAFMEMLRLL